MNPLAALAACHSSPRARQACVRPPLHLFRAHVHRCVRFINASTRGAGPSRSRAPSRSPLKLIEAHSINIQPALPAPHPQHRAARQPTTH
jgi:hypothetical protein